MAITDTTDRTGRWIVAGIWACALIVMATSATNAVLTFQALEGGHALIGAGLGIAVDLALCVVLIGDRRLSTVGQSTVWGRRIRITTCLMSLAVNVTAAMQGGHYVLAVLHAFLPVLLIGLTEYSQEVLLRIAALSAAADTTPDADASRRAAEVARRERDNAVAQLAAVRHELTAQRDEHQTAVRELRDAITAATKPARDTTPPPKPGATPDQRRAWVRRQLTAGRDVTGADVHRQFPGCPRDGARIVRQVRSENTPGLALVATRTAT